MMTKTELRAMEMHALVGRVVELEHLRDELVAHVAKASSSARATDLRARLEAVTDDLAAATAVYRMRLRRP